MLPDASEFDGGGMDRHVFEQATEALDEADGVVAQAAKRLKMGRTTLVEKMRKYDIHRPEGATEF